MAEKGDNYEFVPNTKAKSDVWDHFWLKVNKETKKAIEGLAICRHCDQAVKYSGGTSCTVCTSAGQPNRNSLTSAFK